MVSPLPEDSRINYSQPQTRAPIASMTTPTPAPDIDVGERIRRGLVRYGGEDLPALKYLPHFTEATKKYPMFQHNPYLLPQMTILETSGGRNITRPNNLLNWGISFPGNNQAFSKMKAEDVLNTAISGLGERSPYYKKFRQSRPLTREEVEEFARTYEPANPDYGRSLWEGMETFRKG